MCTVCGYVHQRHVGGNSTAENVSKTRAVVFLTTFVLTS